MMVADNPAAKACAARKKSNSAIEIVFDNKPTRYDFSKNVKQLTSMGKTQSVSWSKKNDFKRRGATVHTNGLTNGKISYRIQSELSARPASPLSKTMCPHVRKVQVVITHESTIYVASKHKKGACEYKEIWEHEHKHQRVNEAAAKGLADTLKRDMPEVISYAEGQSISTRSGDVAMKKLGDFMEDAIKFYSDKAIKEMSHNNDAIDTPAEYRRSAEACGHRSAF
ncbi:MAG: hypothetical protein KTR28_03690 [Micavibrio sp.]|nr:hypothetical protein [Micavibrio sp.]